MHEPVKRHHKDQGAKLVLKGLGQPLARFFARHPDAECLDVLQPEWQVVTRRPDLLLRIRHPDRGEFLVLVEVQVKVEPDLPTRLATLTAWAVAEYGLLVLPVVVYMGPVTRNRPSPVAYTVNDIRFEAGFEEIVLPEWDAHHVLTHGLEGPWWPFAAFMKHGREPEAVGRLLREIQRRPELRSVARAMLEMTSLVVEMDQIRAFLEGPMFDKIMTMEPWEGSALWEMREVWKAQAREEGREEAHVQDALRMARRLVAKRFGIPDADLSARLEALSPDTLEALGEALFDMTDRADLEAWLAGQGA
jgi:hypothetical protein